MHPKYAAVTLRNDKVQNKIGSLDESLLIRKPQL